MIVNTYIKGGAALLLLSLALWGGCSIQRGKDASQVHAAETKVLKMENAQIESDKKHIQWVIEQERNKTMALAAIDRKHKEDKERAKDNYNRTIADLRAGNLKLRKKFTCPIPSNTGAVASAGSGNNDQAQAGLSREDEEFLISEASRADEIVLQLDAAQKVIEEYQRKSK